VTQVMKGIRDEGRYCLKRARGYRAARLVAVSFPAI
jgi:hypothetical protein